MFWLDNQLNSSKDQQSRISSAHTLEVNSVNLENQTGIINSYNVSIAECTCRDYIMRRQPCKHMYRLAHELGLYRLCGTIQTNRLLLSRNEAKKIVFNELDTEERKLLFQIFYECIFRKDYYILSTSISLDKLLCNAILESKFDPYLLSKKLSKLELITFASEHSISINKKLKKDEIIDTLQSAHNDILKQLFSNWTIITISERFIPHARSIYNLLYKELGNRDNDSFLVVD